MMDLPKLPPAAPSAESETSLIEIANGILRHWRLVLWLPLLLAAMVGTYRLTQKRTYVAVGAFVPQSTENRGLSGAAALAQQFGVSLGSERAGQSPQFYQELLRSVTILRRAVESPYQLPAEPGPARRGTLLQHWKLDSIKSSIPAWQRGVDRLRGAIATTVRRETGVIDLSVSADDPVLAEQIATRLLALLNDYNLEVRQTRARDEAAFVTARLSEVQGEVRAAENALESFIRNNRDYRNSPELTFQRERLQRQVSARQEVYTTLLRAQEQAQIEGMRDTPVLQIIDTPVGSGHRASRQVLLGAVVAFLLGLLLALGVATAREVARRDRMSNDPYYQEFEQLARTIWHEVRHPLRWVSRAQRSGAKTDAD